MRKSIKAAKAALASAVASTDQPEIVSTNVPAIITGETVSETILPSDVAPLETVLSGDIVSGATAIIDGATGETVAPESLAVTATEAQPDPRAAKQARIAADRAAVRELYAHFEASRLSVPVKPLSAFKLASSSAHPNTRGVSQRQCAAIAVAFRAAGLKLTAGASASRTFEIDGIPSAIENGVIRDAISSGLITVSGDTPESEMLTLGANAVKSISAQLGSKLLTAANLI